MYSQKATTPTPPTRQGKRRRRPCPPRDPRLWLYGRVPAGFWEAPDHRRLYMEWLGAQLGITTPDDWHRLRCADLKRHHGHRLLTMFQSCPVNLLKEYLPHYPWQEWRFGQVPNGFWQTRANRRRYLDWLGQQLGFARPEDWYHLSAAHLSTHHGGRLLTLTQSLVALLKEYLPHYRWQEWKLASAPDGFWEQPVNRRRFLRALGKELGYRRPTDWYQLSNQHVMARGGQGLMKRVHYSILAVLQEYRPTYPWQAWRLASVPDGFWEEPRNRHRYLDWLGTTLGYRCPEDWYQLTAPQLSRHHGSRLLTLFGSSPRAVLRDYQPAYDWKEWLFPRPSAEFWAQAANRQRYLDWLGHQLGYHTAEEWQRLRAADVRRSRGQGLLRYAACRLAPVVAEYLAEHGRSAG